MTQMFEIFHLTPLFMHHHDLSDPLFLQKKISLSLSHLVSDILGPKVGLMFIKMYYLTIFMHFCINFLLNFRSKWPLFSLILDHFDS